MPVPVGPLPREHGYLVQAALLPVLIPGKFAVFAVVTRRRSAAADAARLGRVYALGVVALLVVPEAAALALGGAVALGWVARVALPALFVGVALASARAVAPGRLGAGLRVVLPGLLLQALLGATVLR